MGCGASSDNIVLRNGDNSTAAPLSGSRKAIGIRRPPVNGIGGVPSANKNFPLESHNDIHRQASLQTSAINSLPQNASVRMISPLAVKKNVNKSPSVASPEGPTPMVTPNGSSGSASAAWPITNRAQLSPLSFPIKHAAGHTFSYAQMNGVIGGVVGSVVNDSLLDSRAGRGSDFNAKENDSVLENENEPGSRDDTGLMRNSINLSASKPPLPPAAAVPVKLLAIRSLPNNANAVNFSSSSSFSASSSYLCSSSSSSLSPRCEPQLPVLTPLSPPSARGVKANPSQIPDKIHETRAASSSSSSSSLRSTPVPPFDASAASCNSSSSSTSPSCSSSPASLSPLASPQLLSTIICGRPHVLQLSGLSTSTSTSSPTTSNPIDLLLPKFASAYYSTLMQDALQNLSITAESSS